MCIRDSSSTLRFNLTKYSLPRNSNKNAVPIINVEKSQVKPVGTGLDLKRSYKKKLQDRKNTFLQSCSFLHFFKSFLLPALQDHQQIQLLSCGKNNCILFR